jgi:hypothetical protein
MQQQPRFACSIHRWQTGSTQSRQQCSTKTPAAAYTMLAAADEHLQQIERLEKQLFAKSDGWRGELLLLLPLIVCWCIICSFRFALRQQLGD